MHLSVTIFFLQGHSGLFLQFGSLIKYFKDVKLERQPPSVHHYEGSGIAKVTLKTTNLMPPTVYMP